ncbi:MAG: DNA ligase [Methylococcales bacterium]
MPYLLFLLFSLPLLCNYSLGLANETKKPALTLAKSYQGQVDLTHYLVSEKLDGVRAYWDGKQLISRQGNPYPAPTWFTKNFPAQALDGELWLGRQKFQALISIVRKKHAIDKEWQKLRYFVYDQPGLNKPFSQRLKSFQQLILLANSPYLKALKQYQIVDKNTLLKELARITALGAEGLMLHRVDAFYHAGRNGDLLKVKPYYDAEATVISYIPGKGKFSGKLGSLLVETTEGLRFRIGSGFTNQQRSNPPAIGQLITYTYHGKTLKGIPKFASFLRVREEIN